MNYPNQWNFNPLEWKETKSDFCFGTDTNEDRECDRHILSGMVLLKKHMHENNIPCSFMTAELMGKILGRPKGFVERNWKKNPYLDSKTKMESNKLPPKQ